MRTLKWKRTLCHLLKQLLAFILSEIIIEHHSAPTSTRMNHVHDPTWAIPYPLQPTILFRISIIHLFVRERECSRFDCHLCSRELPNFGTEERYQELGLKPRTICDNRWEGLNFDCCFISRFSQSWN